MTIAEFLTATFGESAKHITHIDNPWIGGAGYDTVSFATSEGRLQTTCGGECIIGFYRKNARPAYLIRDDNEMRAGEWKRRQAHTKYADLGKDGMTTQDWKDYHLATPSATLRLVQSA